MELGIRDFVVGTIIKVASDPGEFDRQKVFLNKLNLVLVQVIFFYATASDRCRIHNTVIFANV